MQRRLIARATTALQQARTREVTITDASHDGLFPQEAVAAVEAWRFEPKVYLDRPIQQRAYVRIRFALE